MKGMTLGAAAVATGLLAVGLAPVASSAAAPNKSVLSVRPLAPKQADVCWTPYQPSGAQTVDLYTLSWTQGATVSTDLDPAVTKPENGKYCVRLDLLAPIVSYKFELAANVGGATVPRAANPLRTVGYLLTGGPVPSHVKAGARSTLSGTLTRAGNPVAGATVRVQQRVLPGGDWRPLASATTNARGDFRKTFRVARNVVVRAYFLGEPGVPTVGSWNGVNRVNARPVLSIAFSKNPVRLGASVRARGSIQAGRVRLLAGDDACLQRALGGKWQTVKCTPINRKGKYSVSLTPSSRKDLSYRWRALNVGPEYEAGTSGRKVLRVL